jgi:hypothetical protein
MVTTLEPVARQAAVRPLETRTQEPTRNAPGYPNTTAVRHSGPSTVTGPGLTSREEATPEMTATPGDRRSFLARVTGLLEAVETLVSGPPMTDRERQRRAANEANCRHSAALMWSQRINW